MMRSFLGRVLAAVLVVCLAACGHEYNNAAEVKAAYDRLSAQPADTVVAMKTNCDTCYELKVLQATIPALPGGAEIAVAGMLPLDVLSKNAMSYDPDMSFRLVGKMLDVQQRGRPVFYVSSFSRFTFRPGYWEEKTAAGLYTRRNRMIQGVHDNLLYNGKSLTEITTLLGQPDSLLQGRISYRVDDNRGGETDPAKALKLDIFFGKDSVITGRKVIDPILNVK